MAIRTKAEIEKRVLKLKAANADPSYLQALGRAFVESGADMGEGLVGRGAGYLNTAQRVFTGTDVAGLKGLQDRGTAVNEQVYQDVAAAGGEDWAKAYAASRELGISFAEAAALGGLGKGVAALSKLRKGAKAAEVASAAAAAGVPATAAKGLWGLIKKHKVASTMIGAGLVGGGVLGAKVIAEEKKNSLAPSLAAGTIGVGTGQSSTDRQGALKTSAAARTYEDFIQAALTAAGFGTPAAKAYHYDPWGTSGGNAPYQATLTGGSAALNPNIVGGRAPTLKDVRRMNMGTQESQNAYADQLDARAAAMAQSALAGVGPAYAAYQQGQGLRQGLMAKQDQEAMRNQVSVARTMYNRDSMALENARAAGTLDEKTYTKERRKLRDAFGAVLEQMPETADEELALAGG
jgi:hypothetical protein